MSEIGEIANRTFDQVAGVKRVAILPATVQRLYDTSAGPTTLYVGVAYAGASQADTKSWLLEKVVTSSSGAVVTHATDSWANRATATYS